ncbi:complexin isoform X2 [Lingula anatina]|uniref:Complexin isoform X2 n=1 Tax=Lingula anatina TaxID=7574 RepID=A0A1S3I3U2_LINAN|nr:complexin isoform X2 [Lingula anatina]|eukprot:XP_013392903.1 complexin isoform X2 [Lingula anatina]
MDLFAGAVGGGDDESKGEEGEAGEDPEVAEARREAEEKRIEKHRKMEEEREELRQGIRDKYGIKKKDPFAIMEDPDMEGRLGRKRKTPAELAAEAQAAEEDEGSLPLPGNLGELTSKASELKGELTAKVTEKCTVQ